MIRPSRDLSSGLVEIEVLHPDPRAHAPRSYCHGPAHVLLSYEDYERLLGTGQVLDRLAEPAGVEDIELVLPASDEGARPAEFG